MDQKQKSALRASLLDEKEKIEAQLSEIAKKNPAIKGDWTAVPIDASDPADTLDEKAQTVTDLEERRAVEQNLELRLKEIDEALVRLDSNTYGLCSNCHSPIEPKRLIAMPTVSRCIECASNPVLA